MDLLLSELNGKMNIEQNKFPFMTNQPYDPELTGINFAETKAMAENLWETLAGASTKPKATITKIAFIHQVTAMLDAMRGHDRVELLNTLSVMSPEQFQQFLEMKRKLAELGKAK